MRFLLLLVSILVLSFLGQYFFPWWAIVPIALIGGFALGKNNQQAFLGGFLAIFLLWTGQTLWMSLANEGILANKMGLLLGGVPGGALPFVSGIIGGLLAGLAAWTGFLGRRALV